MVNKLIQDLEDMTNLRFGFAETHEAKGKQCSKCKFCVRFPHRRFFNALFIFVTVHVYTSQYITHGRSGHRVQRHCELGLIFCLITH